MAIGVTAATASLAMPDPVRAEAAIDIVATAEDPAFWFDDALIDIVVSNPGSESLSGVTVDVYLDPTDLVPTTGPVVLGGNADDVLDPGEEWRYSATVNWTTRSLGAVQIQVVATTPDLSAVSAETWAAPELVFPVASSAASDVTEAVEGSVVSWIVTTTNIADFAVPIELRARVLYPDWRTQGPIPFTAVDSPIDRGDGDEDFEPGETWRWEYAHEVYVDDTYLEVDVTARDTEGFGIVDVVLSSELTVTPPIETTIPPSTAPSTAPPPITVPPSTTASTVSSPPTGPLPSTGLSATLTTMALAVAMIGALLVAIARSRPPTSR